MVEARADLAGVHEGADVVVVAEQQCAEVAPRALRIRPATDDELLALLALELQPVRRATGGSRAIGALGDQPLPAGLARLREVGVAVSVAVLA